MKSYFCFSCKERYPIGEIAKEGRTKKGKRWYVCSACSAAYREKINVKLDRDRWHGGVLCPRCESENRHDDGKYPLRTVWCDDCGFNFTLQLAA